MLKSFSTKDKFRMNAKIGVIIIIGIAVIVGIGFGLSNSENESNEEFELIPDNGSVELQDSEGKQFTLELSDSVTVTRP